MCFEKHPLKIFQSFATAFKNLSVDFIANIVFWKKVAIEWRFVSLRIRRDHSIPILQYGEKLSCSCHRTPCKWTDVFLFGTDNLTHLFFVISANSNVWRLIFLMKLVDIWRSCWYKKKKTFPALDFYNFFFTWMHVLFMLQSTIVVLW